MGLCFLFNSRDDKGDPMNTQFEVQTELGGSWENCWTDIAPDDSETPSRFETRQAARQALADYYRDRRDAYFCGDMVDKPDRFGHRIVEVIQ